MEKKYDYFLILIWLKSGKLVDITILSDYISCHTTLVHICNSVSNIHSTFKKALQMYIDIHTEHINITIIIIYNLPEPRRAVKKRNSSLKAVMSSVTLARRTKVKFSNVTLYIATRRFSSKRNYPLYMMPQKHNPALIT